MAETTSQPSAPAVPQPPHRDDEHHRRWFMRFLMLGWIPIRRSAATLILSWLFPFFMMAIGYAFRPLRLPVVLPWDAPVDTWGGIVIQLALMIIWLIYEWWYTNHRNTAISELQADFAGDAMTTLFIAIMFGALIQSGHLRWWFLVPLIGALLDLMQSGLQGINNAAEKPSVGPKLGT